MNRLTYYRDKLSMRRPFDVPAKMFQCRTEDGVRIMGAELGPLVAPGSYAFLVVHGLVANHLAPGFREFAEALTRYGPVFTIDLRGHGLSGGRSTLGNLEALDVAAALRYLRSRSELPSVVVGFSMGAGAAIRAAALYERPDAVVAVSSPARWEGWRGRRARQVSRVWRTPGGTTLLRAITGVRIEPRWATSESPAEVVAKISPGGLLVVQGEADEFFPPEEGRELLREASEPKRLWLIEDGGHAEGLFIEPGRPPDRHRVDRFAGEIVSRVADLVAGSSNG